MDYRDAGLPYDGGKDETVKRKVEEDIEGEAWQDGEV